MALSFMITENICQISLQQFGIQQKEPAQNMGTNKGAKLTQMWQNSKYFQNQDFRQNYKVCT